MYHDESASVGRDSRISRSSESNGIQINGLTVNPVSNSVSDALFDGKADTSWESSPTVRQEITFDISSEPADIVCVGSVEIIWSGGNTAAAVQISVGEDAGMTNRRSAYDASDLPEEFNRHDKFVLDHTVCGTHARIDFSAPFGSTFSISEVHFYESNDVLFLGSYRNEN